MESHRIEHEPPIELHEVSLSDKEALTEIAALITKYSWFEGYPVDPMDELRQSDYIVGAYAGKTLAGFGSINRVASPDGQDNGAWWFADAVVKPEYRERGIYTSLYEARMQWLENKPGRVLTCTETEIIDQFVSEHGWRKIRDTRDEEGNDCRVYEYPRDASSSEF